MNCIRCGQCCMVVGRQFWVHGDYSKYSFLGMLADVTVDEDDGLPCEMLRIENGIATCMIQAIFGERYKPLCCRLYPEFEKCHQEEKKFQGQGICYQLSG